ncbi:MAG: hypothetical protein JOY84_18955 [Curvibacter sp.]|nr:hypothetical protein [Curvibacter sp.]
MIAFLDILVFCLAYTFLYHGVVQGVVLKKKKNALYFIVIGAVVLFLGAIYWHLNANAFARLAETQNLFIPQPNFVQQKFDLEEMEPSSRKLASLKLASMQFVSGAQGVKVLTEGGQWVDFAPAFEDWKEREKYLQIIANIKQQKNALDADAIAARRAGMRWLIGVWVAIGAGIFLGFHIKAS